MKNAITLFIVLSVLLISCSKSYVPVCFACSGGLYENEEVLTQKHIEDVKYVFDYYGVPYETKNGNLLVSRRIDKEMLANYAGKANHPYWKMYHLPDGYAAPYDSVAQFEVGPANFWKIYTSKNGKTTAELILYKRCACVNAWDVCKVEYDSNLAPEILIQHTQNRKFNIIIPKEMDLISKNDTTKSHYSLDKYSFTYKIVKQ